MRGRAAPVRRACVQIRNRIPAPSDAPTIPQMMSRMVSALSTCQVSPKAASPPNSSTSQNISVLTPSSTIVQKYWAGLCTTRW